MSRTPLVSVVMPVYNAAATVEAAVRSLLAQTHEHLEILVVDDGSVDGSPDLVAGLRDSRIRLVRQEHRGLVATRNHGCALAQGAYIAPLDADDLSHPRRIAAQLEYLEGHPGVGLVGTWARLVSDEQEEGTFHPPVSDPALRRYLLWDSPFVHSAVMFRRAALQGAGGYPEGLAEDYRLWIRIARSWKIANLPEVLVTHRIHRASYTRTQRRAAALKGRLAAQWEAARWLGPWYAAAPALGVTCAAYLLALGGGRVEANVRKLARGRFSRRRGFSDARPRGDSG